MNRSLSWDFPLNINRGEWGVSHFTRTLLSSEKRILEEKTLHERQKNNLARKYIWTRKEKT